MRCVAMPRPSPNLRPRRARVCGDLGGLGVGAGGVAADKLVGLVEDEGDQRVDEPGLAPALVDRFAQLLAERP